jgi:hypothetical protein
MEAIGPADVKDTPMAVQPPPPREEAETAPEAVAEAPKESDTGSRIDTYA